MTGYDDILHAERPRSAKHPPMSRPERAKQFLPFATLRGFGDLLTDREDSVISRMDKVLEEEEVWEDENSSV